MSGSCDNSYNLVERIEDAFSQIDDDICSELRDADGEYQEKQQER